MFIMNWELIWISITAVASWALVGITWFLIRKQIKTSRDDLKVRIQTTYDAKFESHAFIKERKKLAKQLLSDTPHEEIQETVINFFESVGMLLRRGYLDNEMVWCGFGFYAVRWWNSCKDYIFEERRRQNGDKTIFAEFEYLVDEVFKVEIKERQLNRAQLELTKKDINSFLSSERDL